MSEKVSVSDNRYAFGLASGLMPWLSCGKCTFRRLRVQYSGAIYHAMTLGNHTEQIYLVIFVDFGSWSLLAPNLVFQAVAEGVVSHFSLVAAPIPSNAFAHTRGTDHG